MFVVYFQSPQILDFISSFHKYALSKHFFFTIDRLIIVLLFFYMPIHAVIFLPYQCFFLIYFKDLEKETSLDNV